MAGNKSDIELILRARDVSATKTVKELSDATDALVQRQSGADKAFSDSAVKLQKLRAVMDELVQVERELIGKGNLVQRYRDQAKAVTDADVRTKKLIATARDLRTQLRTLSADDPGRNKLAAQFEAASVQAQKASNTFRQQRSVLRALKTELAAAGIATQGLAAEEQRLVGIAQRVAAAQGQTASALARLQTGARGAGGAMRAFARDSRNSLSITQRLRGELLSLAAASVGLFGLGREVGKTFGAVRQKEAIESRLRVAFQDDPAPAQAVERELAFLEATSERLKISFLTLGTSYSKFISAVPEGIFTLQEQRKIFEDLSIGARVMRLSTEDLEGTFKAIIQIASKASFQMEELRGQLGDRLPGALLLFAKRLGVSTRELDKMVEQGQVGAEKIIELADAIKNRFGGDLEKALGAPTARLDDFLRIIEKIRLEIGQDKGFIDELTKALSEVSTEIKKPEFKEGLAALARGITLLAKGAVVLVQNLDAVKVAFVAFLGLRGLGGLISSVFRARAAVAGLVKGMRLLRAAAFVLSGPGSWLLALVGLLATLALRSDGAKRSLAELRGELEKLSGEGLKKLSIGDIDGQLETLQVELKAASARADELNKRLQKNSNPLGRAAFVRQLDEELDRISLLVDMEIKLASARNLRFGLESRVSGEAPGRIAGLSDTELDGLGDAIDTANEKIAELDADTLAKKLALIAQKYESFFARLRESIKRTTDRGDTDKLKELNGQLATVVAALEAEQGAVRFEFRKRTLNQLEQLEQAAARRGESQLEATLNNIRARYKKASDDLREIGDTAGLLRVEILLAGDLDAEIRTVRDTLRRELLQLRADDGDDLDARLALVKEKYLALIAALRKEGRLETAQLAEQVLGAQLAETTKGFGGEQIQRAEAEINKLLELRTAIITRINAERDSGFVSAQDARANIRAELDSLDPRIESMIDKAAQLAEHLSAQNLLGEEETRLFLEGLRTMALGLQNLETEALIRTREIKEQFATGLTNAISEWARGLEDGRSALESFFGEYLQFLGEAIIKEELLRQARDASGFGQRVASGFGGLIAGEGFAGFAAPAAKGATEVASGAVEQATATTLAAGATTLTTGATALVSGATGLTAGSTALTGAASALVSGAGGVLSLAGQQLLAAATALISAAGTLAAAGASSGGASLVAGVLHQGGLAGAAGIPQRLVSPALFRRAPRFHTGGGPGLKPGEVATILEKTEEVLPRSDPRHVLNGGGARGGAGGQARAQKIINLYDLPSARREIMATPAGVELIFNALGENPARLEALLRR